MMVKVIETEKEILLLRISEALAAQPREGLSLVGFSFPLSINANYQNGV